MLVDRSPADDIRRDRDGDDREGSPCDQDAAVEANVVFGVEEDCADGTGRVVKGHADVVPVDLGLQLVRDRHARDVCDWVLVHGIKEVKGERSVSLGTHQSGGQGKSR